MSVVEELDQFEPATCPACGGVVHRCAVPGCERVHTTTPYPVSRDIWSGGYCVVCAAQVVAHKGGMTFDSRLAAALSSGSQPITRRQAAEMLAGGQIADGWAADPDD